MVRREILDASWSDLNRWSTGVIVALGVGWFLGGLLDRNISSGRDVKRGETSRLVRRGVRVPVRGTRRRRVVRRGAPDASWSELDMWLIVASTGGMGGMEGATAGAGNNAMAAELSSSESVTMIKSGQRLTVGFLP